MKPVFIESKAVNNGHYVPGMISGHTLYISGQLPMDHLTGVMCHGAVAEQARQALDNVGLVLASAGAGKEDVVLCRVYVPDVALWDEVNRIYADWFGSHRPARVVVPCGPLHHGVLVEIEAVAELRGDCHD
ncbi:MAG: RidA family protein [Ruminococcaceae bacterium]|jgi:reactive intermediate/imine deaminase|nr:RidA family protein [Oscillospiraceae bacterium]